MDYRDNNTVPTRRRTQSASVNGSGAKSGTDKSGARPAARIKAVPSDGTARRSGEYTARMSARSSMSGSHKSAPVVRSAPRPASSASRQRAAASDYHKRVQGNSASGNASGTTIRPSRQSAGAARNSGAKRASAPRSVGAGVRHTRKERNPKWATALVCVCAIALLGVGYVGFGEISNYIDYQSKCRELEQQTFYDGITLEGESLSGLTLLDAVDKYQKQLSNVASTTSVTINARGKSYTLDSNSVQMSTNLQSTLSLAYSTGRSGSFEERYAQLQELKANGMNFSLNRGWNEQTLRAKIAEIAADVYVKGQDADVESFDPDTGKFTFISEVTGYELDTEDLYSQITQAIANGNVTATIDAKVKEVPPEHTVEYMREHFGRISYMKTETTSNSDRNKNIDLASSQFNGMRVDPGETVSFNETTGERTPEKGYREAGAYSNGILIQEPGGGVCQVSTTLYNAIAKADLEIVDRSPHSRPVDYVGIGLDAAVNWPSQDFAFKNNTDYPIFIVANYADRELEFKVYGHQMENGMYIMLESEKTETVDPPDGVEEKYDSSIPSGTTKTEKARSGSRAVSYKVYYDSEGNEIKREKLANSYYKPSATVLRIGTGS